MSIFVSRHQITHSCYYTCIISFALKFNHRKILVNLFSFSKITTSQNILIYFSTFIAYFVYIVFHENKTSDIITQLKIVQKLDPSCLLWQCNNSKLRVYIFLACHCNQEMVFSLYIFLIKMQYYTYSIFCIVTLQNNNVHKIYK